MNMGMVLVAFFEALMGTERFGASKFGPFISKMIWITIWSFFSQTHTSVIHFAMIYQTWKHYGCCEDIRSGVAPSVWGKNL
jgi:hypothetical protein